MAKLLWSQRQNIGPVRWYHSLAYDANRRRTVFFGGLAAADPKISGDTWEWDGQHWVQVADFGPKPRWSQAMAYDENRMRVVLFGGLDGANRSLGDPWEWDREFWIQVADSGPSAQSFFAMTSDTKRKRIVLFSGAVVTRDRSITRWRNVGMGWKPVDEA